MQPTDSTLPFVGQTRTPLFGQNGERHQLRRSARFGRALLYSHRKFLPPLLLSSLFLWPFLLLFFSLYKVCNYACLLFFGQEHAIGEQGFRCILLFSTVRILMHYTHKLSHVPMGQFISTCFICLCNADLDGVP